MDESQHIEGGYRATDYALRELENTDLLAFRFVAEARLLTNYNVLDLGCGAGRSSRFLTDLGNRIIGIDKSLEMIAEARRKNPEIEFVHLPRGTRFPLPEGSFDAVFSSWMILEEGDEEEIIRLLRECRRVLRPKGTVVMITNTPEFYRGKWLSCLTDHPENSGELRSGQKVRVTLLPESVEIVDYFWSDADYRRFFGEAGFRVLSADYPLGRADDRLPWKDEMNTAPYVIYRLERD